LTLAEYRQVNRDQWVSMGPAAQTRHIAQFGPPPAGWPRPSAALVPATVQYPVPLQPSMSRPVPMPVPNADGRAGGPSYAVHRRQKNTSDGLHLFLTIITGARWAFVWIGMTIWHACGPHASGRRRPSTALDARVRRRAANTVRSRLRDTQQLATSNFLLVYRVDRFSRSLADTVALLERLDQAGVVFRSSTEPFDTSGPMGRMLLQLLAMFAQFERDTIIERVIAGMERKAAKGKWKGGRRPFGYQVDKSTQTLVVDRGEAVIVRTIFDLCTRDRLGSKAVAAVLNDRGCDVVAPPVRTRKAAARHPPTLV
jgi:DNA invertase Pin-like site-specific DNA recombinase